jgi:hypothetical protein
MIRLASIIDQFEGEFLKSYQGKILPSQLKALQALKRCRTEHSPMMRVSCSDCDHQLLVPHSCGHRHCPHCQHHESQQWITNQVKKQLPALYFMITFTLPSELRSLAWQHQKAVYKLMFQCGWETLLDFSRTDKVLKGTPGVVAVLHTHSRALNFHPHIHAVLPAAAIDKTNRLWRKKKGKFLFHHKALAKVFRAKMLAGLVKLGLTLPQRYPEKWVVDCKSVGSGDKALVYLGRYLYRGVIQEKDILCCQDGQVTFRYIDSDTGKTKTRTVAAVKFLWLVLQHVLPRGFRRARNFGFLHPNSKTLIKLIHLLLKFDPKRWLPKRKPRPQLLCKCCGGLMIIVKTRIQKLKPIIKVPQQLRLVF